MYAPPDCSLETPILSPASSCDSPSRSTSLKASSRARYVGGPRPVHSGTQAFRMESARGMYGLISIIGESSKASSPFTINEQSSTFINFTTHKPIGFGLEGLLQAKTPTFTFFVCLLGTTRNTLLSFSLSRK